MGSNTAKNLGASGRSDLLWFDDGVLTLIEDPKHALYDDRVKLPLDEKLVLNIMHHGVLEPVLITPDGVVLDGKQRVRHAREANRRLKAEGKEPTRIPAVLRRGDDATMQYGVLVSANIHREDSPLEKARKASKLEGLGKNAEEIGIAMGVTAQTARGYLALASCAAPIQKAVENGHVAATVAANLARLPKDEQGPALEKLIAEGKAQGVRGVKAASLAGGRTPRTRMKGRKHLGGLLTRIEDAEKDERPDAVRVLKYVLGDEDALGKKWRGEK